jgi:hypothetical protein
MASKDLESGLYDASTQPHNQVAEKMAQDSSSSQPSAAREATDEPEPEPEMTETSREPDLMDVFKKWTGRPDKPQKPYANPPRRGERHELEVFQNLVGIHFLRPGGGLLYPEDQGQKPASPMHDIFLPTKAAERRWRNRGLYDRTLSQDLKNRVLYGMSNYIITSLYILQIFIAAALTGLSAYGQGGSTVALTTLGAINTVLAGILAWLNGQGMPVRFRRARDQYREVVRAIEDTERTFAEIDYVDWPPGTRPNPYAERDRLEQMYNEARQDQETNYPDIQEGPNKMQMQQEAQQLRETISEEKSKKGSFSKLLEKTRDDHKSQLQNLEKSVVDRIKKAVADQEDRIRTEVEFKHLKKVAEEEKRKFDEEKARLKARLGEPFHPDEPVARPVQSPENPRNEEQPRERPQERPRETSRERSPGRPRSGSRKRSPARSPARSPTKPRDRSPARSPPRRRDEPRTRSPARSRTRSPARPRDRSPARSPIRPRDRSPARSPRQPSAPRARSPERPRAGPSQNPPANPPPNPEGEQPPEGPGYKGPPGLFVGQELPWLSPKDDAMRRASRQAKGE